MASSNSTNSTDPLQRTNAIGWDGWKILMENMNLGFELPPRNTDPNFVPVPPTVRISSISVKGEVNIKFSKPVFTFDNLKTRRIAEGRRNLIEEETEVVEQEEEANGTGRQFLKIDILPGGNSNQELLTLDYEANFIDG